VATSQQIGRAVDAIEESLTTTHGPVLVCCALGFSRSAVAVAAWLLASGRAASIAEAVACIRASRTGVVLRDGHIAALECFAAGLVRKAA
jgi:protein-tyrosine phosphatase